MQQHLRATLLTFILISVADSQVVETAESDHSNLTYYVDQNGDRQPIQNLDDWKVRRSQILAGIQQAMGPLPDRSELGPLDIKKRAEISGDGFVRKTVDFTSGDGDRIPADIYFPSELAADAKVPGILALHPTGLLGKRIVAGEGPRPNRQYAVELAQRGYIVIAPDYPSFGDYKDYDFSSDDYVSGTMKGIFNHMRCIDVLTQALGRVDPERIGVIGHSLGGHNAMFVAAFDERIDVVVSSCGWTPFHDYYGGKIKGWTSDRYMPLLRDKYELDPDQVPFDFYEVVGTLAPRPFFSSSPKDDANFDVNGVRKAIPRALGVYALYDAEKNLQVRYPDCDHDFPTETRAEAYRFIDKALNFTPVQEIDFSSELPRIAGRTPQEALDSFEVAPGFQIEQTAAEPLVTDPVAMSFDEYGRLYVVEMKDYSEQDQDRLGQVRLLTDTDSDGKFDKSTIFADDLSWPTAIICSQGGVFVGAAPEISFLKDHDGDGKADEQRVVFTGFERTNVQGLLNSFRWGPDNRIHGATSSSGGVVKRADDPNDLGVNLRRRDFSFDPIKLDLRAENGGAQHGMSFDDWGRKFVCSNSDHAQMVMYDDRDLARNPTLPAPGPRVRIADDGGQAPVFRISQIEPWRIVRTRLRVSGQVGGPVEGGGKPAGYFTGATGVTAFRGDAYGDAMNDTLIVGDVGSNIVHRKELRPRGATFVATRIDEKSELVRSSDVWFRPVQFANGPDGCLHILDMYRETIEHPKSLPPEIKQHLDLTSGRDCGRLYRLVPQNGLKNRQVKLGDFTNEELVKILAHPNGWHRDTASRLLYERQDQSIIQRLISFVASTKSPYGKVHAASLLTSYDALPIQTLRELITNDLPHVREVTVRIARWHPEVAQLSNQLLMLKDDPDSRVRYEIAFTAGQLESNSKIEILKTLLKSDGNDSWMMLAALSSLSDGLTEVFQQLLQDDSFLNSKQSNSILQQVLIQICRQERVSEVLSVLNSLNQLPDDQTTLKSSLLRSALGAQPTLRNQLNSDELEQLVNQIFERANRVAFDESKEISTRVAAIRDFGIASDQAAALKLLGLFDHTSPQEIQSAVLETASTLSYHETIAAILSRSRELSPRLWSQAEEILFSDPRGIAATLDAIESEQLKAPSVSRIRLENVAKSQNSELSSRATEILSNLQTPSRLSVIEDYRSALKLSGNPGRGRQVFLKNCSTCHHLGGEGTEIGPNLATIKNRGAETILLNVLDPNREVNPQYLNYAVEMKSGKVHSGIIAEETTRSVTLVRAEKKTDTLAREEIESMINTGLSIMPEGLEKEITEEQMADLIAYLMSIQ